MGDYLILNNEYYNVKKNFYFNKTIKFGNDSPYIFTNHFINLNYSDYVRNVTDLLKYTILDEEITFLKKYYGKKTICNKYKLDKIISKNLYTELVHSLIINKRIEFLLEYINNKNYSINCIDYTNKLLDDLYKNTKYLIDNLFN
tara:strand:+ start:633 stop:1064 length:432 start_codon:yes stop_codon:yes gene_type:complete